MTFAEHINQMVETALARLMRNVGGPTPQKRQNVVMSTMLYAAPIYINKNKMESVVRKSNMRIVMANRTMIAAQVLINLIIIERARAFGGWKANPEETNHQGMPERIG